MAVRAEVRGLGLRLAGRHPAFRTSLLFAPDSARALRTAVVPSLAPSELHQAESGGYPVPRPYSRTPPAPWPRPTRPQPAPLAAPPRPCPLRGRSPRPPRLSPAAREPGAQQRRVPRSPRPDALRPQCPSRPGRAWGGLVERRTPPRRPPAQATVPLAAAPACTAMAKATVGAVGLRLLLLLPLLGEGESSRGPVPVAAGEKLAPRGERQAAEWTR